MHGRSRNLRGLDSDAKRNAGPFPETADIETSSDAYAARFGGPHGAWMLEVQERIALALLRPLGARTVLDVGGGHGQLAIPLARDGYDVTILGSDESCRHRVRGLVDAGRARFVVGNTIDLPFPDRAFDAVVCFRLITHCEAWPRLIAELCRVARLGVVADYPTSSSVNAIAPALFAAKKKYERDTRRWTLFTHAQIRSAFETAGFRVAARRGQFFFPMVLHRMFRRRGISAALEGAAGALGLRRLLGSPVILRAVPQADKP
jgi:2-polyprenyl-3-methyl-5-hydroxy-6-metoxy-1,4-benzoquinol methylase